VPPAVLAALATEELHAGGVGDPDGEEVAHLGLMGRPGGGADAADQALGQHAVEDEATRKDSTPIS
jgi:hypothetical protein